MKKWKRISRERVYDHRYFKVAKDLVELPNGEQVEWLFWDSTDSTMIVAENSDGKLVMIRQYRYLPDEIALEFASGGSSEGELLEDCARREFEEETGYEASELIPLGGFYETMAQLNKKIHLFYAPNVEFKDSRDKFAESTEDIEVVLIDPSEMEADILKGEIHSMGTCLAYFLYKEFKK